MNRHTRQIRLREIGEAGQARIAAAEVRVEGSGLSAEVCASYLAGAGIGSLAVSDDAAARAAHSVDSGMRVRVEPSACTPAPLPFEVRNAAARAVAEGASRALAVLRRVVQRPASSEERARGSDQGAAG